MPHYGQIRGIQSEAAPHCMQPQCCFLNEKVENWELHNHLTCELWVRREAVPEVSSFLTPGNDFMDAGIYSQKHCMSDVPD